MAFADRLVSDETLEIRRLEVLDLLAETPESIPDDAQSLGKSSSEAPLLIQEFNAVTDHQERLKEITRLKLSSLPTEIILECFQYAIDDDYDFVFNLCLLGKSWMEMILCHPSLWTRITIDNKLSAEDLDERLQTLLPLSQNLFLSITLRFSKLDTEIDLQYLLAHKDRIRTLSLELPATTMTQEEFYSDLNNLIEDRDAAHMKALRQLWTLRYLERIERTTLPSVKSPYKGTLKVFPQEMAQCYPQIEIIDGWQIRSEFNQLEAFDRSKLKALSVLSPLHDFIFEHFPSMQSLQTLEISSLDQNELSDTTCSEIRKLTAQSSITKILVMANLNPLLFMNSSLRNVSVQVTWTAITEILDGCISLNALSDLCLVIASKNVPDCSYIYPHSVPALKSVQTFGIVIVAPSDSDARRQSQTSLEMFCSTWQFMLPNVKILVYNSTESPPLHTLFIYLQGLTKLEGVYMKIDQVGEVLSQNIPKYDFPSLLCLECNIPEVLRFIKAPDMRYISIHGQDSEYVIGENFNLGQTVDCLELGTNLVGFLTNSTTKTTESSTFPNTEEIRWIAPGFGPAVGAEYTEEPPIPGSRPVLLPTLKIESLRKVHFDVGIEQYQQHDFLIALMTQPDALPHLHTISLGQFPSFSLLLRALFRRNMRRLPKTFKSRKPRTMQDVGHIGEIRELILPSIPTANLLLRISYILARKIAPERLREVDLPEVEFEVMDPSVYGCHDCFLTGLVCETPLNESAPECDVHCRGSPASSYDVKEDDLKVFFQGLYLLNRDPEGVKSSSAQDEEWVEIWRKTWTQREWIVPHTHAGHTRAASCSRHDARNPVTIRPDFCMGPVGSRVI